MEIAIAVYALLVPFLFRWVDHVYALIWQQLHPGFFAFSLWRFLLSGVGAACAYDLDGRDVAGACGSPRSIVRKGFKLGNKALCMQSCGRDSGTLAAGFVLLPWLGVRTTIAVAAMLNVFVGVDCDFLQRRANQ